MNLSFDRKITIGFALLVIFSVTICAISIQHSSEKYNVFVAAAGLASLSLLVMAYIVIRKQFISQSTDRRTNDDKSFLMRSVLDNTSTPVFIKKINGEYLYINKPCEKLFNHTAAEVIGKEDRDFLAPEIAQMYRESDLEIVRANKEMKIEEHLVIDGVPKTYLAVKFPLYDITGRIYAIGSISTDITDRKLLEQSREEGDNFFKLSLDILIIISEGKIVKANPALSQILGYSESELSNKILADLIHPDDLSTLLHEFKTLQSGWEKITLENRWICKDGTIKWLSMVTTYDQKKNHFYSVAHDISSRRANQEKLKVYEKFFNSAFDIMVVASRQYFILVNPTFMRVLGYEQIDINDASLLTLCHPDDLKMVTEEIEKLFQGAPMVQYEARIRGKDRTYKLLDWNVTSDRSTGLIYAVARDITAENQIKEEKENILNQLYDSDQMLRMILENIGDGVVVANMRKQVILSNRMAHFILGIDPNEIVKANLSEQFEILYPDEQTTFPSQKLPMELAFNGYAADNVDVILINRIKEFKKRLLLSGRPIIDHDGKIAAAVLTIKDISKYKEIEQELKVMETKYKNVIGFRKNE